MRIWLLLLAVIWFLTLMKEVLLKGGAKNAQTVCELMELTPLKKVSSSVFLVAFSDTDYVSYVVPRICNTGEPRHEWYYLTWSNVAACVTVVVPILRAIMPELRWVGILNADIDDRALTCVRDVFHDVVAVVNDHACTMLELKGRMRKDVESFALTLRNIKYLGICKINLPNITPQLHPTDHFQRSMMMRFAQDEVIQVESEFKRVNPTFKLKLAHMKKYDATPDVTDHVREGVRDRTFAIFDEIESNIRKSSEFESVRADLIARLRSPNTYDDVVYDPSTAAGFPFKAGIKRRDAYPEAAAKAARMFHDDALFRETMNEHVWYTTGRAKMTERTKEDSARMVMYPGFSQMLLLMKYTNWFTDRFCVHAREWSAIGMSWTKNGADKYAKHFGLEKGDVSEGYKMIGIDISGWDSSLSAMYLEACRDGHIRFLQAMVGDEVEDLPRWIEIIRILYDDMICAKVLFPGGHVFQLDHGMKSGWPFTGVDNTIAHECVLRALDEKVSIIAQTEGHPFNGRIVRTVGGDDVAMKPPVWVHDDVVVQHYADSGFKPKHVRSARRSEQIDFYAKYVKYDEVSGHYYPWRPTSDSFSRLLMPEEYDIQRRTQHDAIVCAQRTLGHLIDNFYNKRVRETCYSILHFLVDNYHIYEVDVEEFARRMRWRGLDFGQVTKLPTVLPPHVIEQMYGVPIVEEEEEISSIDALYEKGNLVAQDVPRFDIRAYDVADTSADLAETLSYRLNYIRSAEAGSSADNSAKMRARYFKVPPESRGVAGAKMTEMVTFTPSSILLVGSHPGSMAWAAHHKWPKAKIDNVSTIPRQDVKKPFYKGPHGVNIRYFDADYLTWELPEDIAKYDAVIIDAYEVNEKLDSEKKCRDMVAEHTAFVDKCVTRASRHGANIYVKLRGFDPSVYAACYRWMTLKASFDIIKPLYSHPWNVEHFVKLESAHRLPVIPRQHLFYKALNNYRNKHAYRLMTWCKVKAKALDIRTAGGTIPLNPLQADVKYQETLKAKARLRQPAKAGVYSWDEVRRRHVAGNPEKVRFLANGKHRHVCSECLRAYRHKHPYSELNHDQFQGECPWCFECLSSERCA